jgi:ABC-type antimicrobial peptide transport system permease subunit
MQQIYDRSMGQTTFTLVMLAIGGSMAMVLSIIGIYGVISFAVAQRRREIGIRMALGARGASVKGMFLRQGLWLTVIGIALGLIAATGLSRLMSSLLFGITRLDPTTYVATSTMLLIVALAATYVPARQASAVDPTETLRSE